MGFGSIDIVGGGIVGTTLATELLREIRKRRLNIEVHLFEKQGQLGIENTEKSFEGVRTFWFTPEEVRFYLVSIRAMQDLASHFGTVAEPSAASDAWVRISANYRPVGYHYFLTEDEFAFSQGLESVFRDEHVPVEFYSCREALRFDWIRNNFDLNAAVLDEDAWIADHFDLDAWQRAGFDLKTIMNKERVQMSPICGYVRVPVAGFVSAGDVVASYRSVFESLGGRLHLNTEIIGIKTEGCRVAGVDFMQGSGFIHTKPTDYVVNAAGVWSDRLNERFMGERLGVVPHRRYPLIVRPPEGYRTDHGMVLLRQRVIRPDEDRIWLYYTPPDETPGIEDKRPDDAVFDTYFFKYIFPVFCHPERPFIKRAETLGLYGGTDRRGWLGHYADTADECPFIGRPRPDILENYAVSTGYSGHGIQASIAAALALTHEILRLDGDPCVKIPERYAADRDLTRSAPDHSRL